MITKVKFTLFSISSSWLFQSVNHTSIYGNAKSNVSKGMKFVSEIPNRLPSGLFWNKCWMLIPVDNYCWQCHIGLILLL